MVTSFSISPPRCEFNTPHWGKRKVATTQFSSDMCQKYVAVSGPAARIISEVMIHEQQKCLRWSSGDELSSASSWSRLSQFVLPDWKPNPPWRDAHHPTVTAVPFTPGPEPELLLHARFPPELRRHVSPASLPDSDSCAEPPPWFGSATRRPRCATSCATRRRNNSIPGLWS